MLQILFMNKIIIWGATGQAIVLEELLSYTEIKIVAFFENNVSVKSPIENIPVYYGETGFKAWLDKEVDVQDYFFLVAIGGGNGGARSEIGMVMKNAGIQPYSAIHPTAFIAKNAVIGESAQILAHACVCAKAVIGNNCIINTAASIDHEGIIGNNVHIGPGARLAGEVTVGDNVFIGTNATILPRITIGKNAVIGAGSVVTKNVGDNAVMIGNPARLKDQ